MIDTHLHVVQDGGTVVVVLQLHVVVVIPGASVVVVLQFVGYEVSNEVQSV